MRYKDLEFARREQVILETASRLFRESNWDKVTVADLADCAGIGKGTVYKHFTSKEEILARLVLDFEQESLLAYRTIADQGPPLQALRQILRKAFDLTLNSPVHAQLNQVCGRPEFQARLQQCYREDFMKLEQDYFGLFGTILQRAIEEGSLMPQPVEPLFLGLLAAFEGAMARLSAGGPMLVSRDINQDIFLDAVIDFMMAGVIGMRSVQAMKSAAPAK